MGLFDVAAQYDRNGHDTEAQRAVLVVRAHDEGIYTNRDGC